MILHGDHIPFAAGRALLDVPHENGVVQVRAHGPNVKQVLDGVNARYFHVEDLRGAERWA